MSYWLGPALEAVSAFCCLPYRIWKHIVWLGLSYYATYLAFFASYIRWFSRALWRTYAVGYRTLHTLTLFPPSVSVTTLMGYRCMLRLSPLEFLKSPCTALWCFHRALLSFLRLNMGLSTHNEFVILLLLLYAPAYLSTWYTLPTLEWHPLLMFQVRSITTLLHNSHPLLSSPTTPSPHCVCRNPACFLNYLSPFKVQLYSLSSFTKQCEENKDFRADCVISETEDVLVISALDSGETYQYPHRWMTVSSESNA